MTKPTFEKVFGDDWDELSNVMKKHYANHSFSNDLTIASGTMKVESSFIGRVLKPFFWLFKILVPYEGENIPVTVNFKSMPMSDVLIFDRVFHFPGKKAYQFYSTLYPIKGNEVIEVMNWGIGWRFSFRWHDEKVKLEHIGYCLRIFGKFIPLPVEFIMGKGYAEEMKIDEDRFSMKMEISHCLWGKVFAYSGVFEIIKKHGDRKS